MACDPTTLAASAKCINNCLSADELDAVATQLMCTWATNIGTPSDASQFSILTELSEPMLTETGAFLESEH